MTDEEAREALQRLIEARGGDYSGLSRLIGRNPAYIQQYLRRGTPRRLAEEDRRRLADFFGVDEAMLGGRPAPARPAAFIPVRQLDLGLSAGAGAVGEGEESRPFLAFDPGWLRRLGAGGSDHLSMLRVQGDSMAPTLADGDQLLIDGSEQGRRIRDGIYALRIDDMRLVKRLSIHPATGRLSIRSDNPAYPSWSDCDPASVEILGRAVWTGRRLG